MDKNHIEIRVLMSEPSRQPPLSKGFEKIRLRTKKVQEHADIRNSTPTRSCTGPSLLHNLLPFVDLCIVVSPKAAFLEDRILRRSRREYLHAPYLVPASFEQLKKWVEGDVSSCDCDQCMPSLYLSKTKKSHGIVQYPQCARSGREVRFHHVHARPTVQHLGLKPGMHGKYETMKLVRHHVDWLETTFLQPAFHKDNIPVLRLQNLLKTWNAQLSGSDLRQSISRPQLLQLFDALNAVFFFGAVPPHRASVSTGFSWLPEAQRNCFGIGSYNALLGTQILLHPTLYRGHNRFPKDHPEDFELRSRNRVGTILHEMCHAFLKAYSCRACPSHMICMGARGHGRAWQILAAKIEQVATKIMDEFIDLGRYPSLLSEIQASGKLPSQHDLEVYQFATDWRSAEA